MENKEYELGQAKRTQSRPRGPMGRGMGGGEKAKDLVGTWKKLLAYCGKYKILLILAVICAMIGTICTLAGPDQLSNMTDTITEGIAPDTDKLQEITEAMSAQISDNMQTVTAAVMQNLAAQQAGGMPQQLEVDGSSISVQDQM